MKLLQYRSFMNIFRKKINYEIVQPAIVNYVNRHIPEHIIKPAYYETGDPLPPLECPDIKSVDQIRSMLESCRLASSILNELKSFIKVGITTEQIDDFVFDRCIANNAYPSPLNYKKFPKSVCTSVNNVVCHGVPDNRALKDGDIINVDVTVFFKGHHGDCSKTYLVGNVDEQGKELVKVTEECLMKGVEICGPGVPFKEIGYAIGKHANAHDYRTFQAVLGHGIGSYFHGPPDIYHCPNTYPGVMKPGMTFTIEPALTSGELTMELLEDNWTLLTADECRSAQAEHTVLVHEDGCTILTDKH